MTETSRQCAQCQGIATVYAMGNKPGDWAGFYCEPCATNLNFQITDRFNEKGAA